ncbi:calcium-binding protein [Dongia sp.]|uniref:calcium-binding protein n=1 Tax=Dongia sp. TaxID=1977262 RepID=UPI0035B3C548
MRQVGTIDDDILTGGTGDDILEGLTGADQLLGGDGRDTAVYLASAAGIAVNLANPGPQSGGDAQGDRFTSIENVTGSSFADQIIGDAGSNVLRGGGGGDLIDGGAGTDRASYAYSAAAVDIDLTRSGPQIGGDAAGDVFVSIENVTGSDHDDRITGNEVNNLISGGAGADAIDGGGGSDTVDYRGSGAVDVDLTRASQIGGDAQGDQLAGIENITGSAFGDRLIGDASANYISGEAGNDYIVGNGAGGGGIDRLNGGDGDDIVIARSGTIAQGGAGSDLLVLHLDDHGPNGGYDLTVSGDGQVEAEYYNTNSKLAHENILGNGFERIEVHGSSGLDNIRGTTGKDRLFGQGGDDFIFGSQGGDYLDGGAGIDNLFLYYLKTSRDIIVDPNLERAYGYEKVVSFERLDVTTDAGNDHIVGASYTSSARTGAGNDYIDFRPSDGNGTLGGNSADTGTGDDYFIGSVIGDDVTARGTGFFDGGAGNDHFTLRSDITGDVVFDYLQQNNGITVVNFEEIDVYRSHVASGNDTIKLSDAAEDIWGGGGNDHLEGRGGNDDLRGEAGNDALYGGDGSDLLVGGSGNNAMTGGAGADNFVFGLIAHDRITDFSSADGDKIYIEMEWWDQPFSFEVLMSLTQDTAEGALITIWEQRSLLLEGILKDDLAEADFA